MSIEGWQAALRHVGERSRCFHHYLTWARGNNLNFLSTKWAEINDFQAIFLSLPRRQYTPMFVTILDTMQLFYKIYWQQVRGVRQLIQYNLHLESPYKTVELKEDNLKACLRSLARLHGTGLAFKHHVGGQAELLKIFPEMSEPAMIQASRRGNIPKFVEN